MLRELLIEALTQGEPVHIKLALYAVAAHNLELADNQVEASRLTGVSRPTLRKYLREGKKVEDMLKLRESPEVS